ncbi:VOC family protein [Pseudonocardia sp. C8]|uniref:VOC family protein n=1 Tax=Pseudonocardia sp. C8 TaxID=2762759 RepID=UPI001643500F|nr:VOC family protein [Pseudonocardia sp. C8]MBC3191879.1 VOC family protein [Pseudonocardia sp. C8]
MIEAERTAGVGVAGVHHVGLVVRDIGAARADFARLGFVVPPAIFPALPPAPGEVPRAFGAGNTHIEFATAFLELVAVVGDGSADPSAGGAVHQDATIQVIDAPDSALPRLAEVIASTAARLRAALDRYEGLHILAFHAPDADLAAAGLDRLGIRHSGVQRMSRPVETPDGPIAEPIGYLELDDSGNTPEGRLAIAENPPADVLRRRQVPDHPNGATGLTEVYLGIDDAELDRHVDRYGRYLDRVPRWEGPAAVFDLDETRVVLVPFSAVATVLPGEQPKGPAPCLLACTVGIRDLAATGAYLRAHRIPVRRHGDRLLVPAAVARGAAMIFERTRGTGEKGRP